MFKIRGNRIMKVIEKSAFRDVSKSGKLQIIPGINDSRRVKRSALGVSLLSASRDIPGVEITLCF